MAENIVWQWRVALRESNLSTLARCVGYVLSTYMNAEGECFPAMETIAKGAGIKSRNTSRKAILELERERFLCVVLGGGKSGGNGKTNRYLINSLCLV